MLNPIFKQCPNCGYEWIAKVENPCSCPRCKLRLDFERKKQPVQASEGDAHVKS